jgi:hypothetical protein
MIGAMIVVATVGAIALVVGRSRSYRGVRRSSLYSRLLFPLPAGIAGSRAHDASGPSEFRQDIAAGLAHLPLTAATKNG